MSYSSGSHGHPVDVVFHYYDPYLKKRIYLNTDLKSYKKSTISQPGLRKALISLAKTIECARDSDTWQNRYNRYIGPSEVRGLLFVYNHDGEFHKELYGYIDGTKCIGQKDKPRPIDLSNLGIRKDQQIHLADPASINYLMTVAKDIQKLSYCGVFKPDSYEFYYPDKVKVKADSNTEKNSATIETIFSPVMIIKHPLKKKDRVSPDGGKYKDGYIIYYNRSGKNYLEFMYLLDMLSTFQILNPDHKIRIRMASNYIYEDAKSSYYKAVDSCAKGWGLNSDRKAFLENIDFEILRITRESFSETSVGWGVQS